MEVIDLIAVEVRSWCAMRSGGGRYGVGGWGMGMGWDRYPDLHTQSLIQTCWSTTCITLIKTQAGGGGGKGEKGCFCWSRGSREGCEELASGNRLRTASQGDNSFCIRGYLLVINDLYHSLHVNLAIEAQHNAS